MQILQPIIISGKVFDGLSNRVVGGDYEGVPSPKVQITDAQGNLTSGKWQVIGDINGNFTMVIPTIAQRGNYLTVSNGLDKRTIPMLSGKSFYKIDVGLKPFETKEEVIATANPDEVKCIQSKGKWSRETKVCSMPQQPKKKMGIGLKILIGLGILVVVGGGVYLATRKSKVK